MTWDEPGDDDVRVMTHWDDEDDWAYIDTAETIDPSNWGY